MQNNVLLTPVDEMVELVRNNPNCTVSFLTQKLSLPEEIVERWLVILDEYKVLDVGYKGFEGFVNISSSHEKKKEDIDIDNLKSVFVSKCRDKGMNFLEMEGAWAKFLTEHEEGIKSLFEEKAKKKGYDKLRIARAWNKFREELERL